MWKGILLLRVAACCSVLQCVAVWWHICENAAITLNAAFPQMRYYTATRCNTLQHAATRCNTLHHAAAVSLSTYPYCITCAVMCCSKLNLDGNAGIPAFPLMCVIYYKILRHTAADYSTLQRTVAHCHTAPHCTTLHHIRTLTIILRNCIICDIGIWKTSRDKHHGCTLSHCSTYTPLQTS